MRIALMSGATTFVLADMRTSIIFAAEVALSLIGTGIAVATHSRTDVTDFTHLASSKAPISDFSHQEHHVEISSAAMPSTRGEKAGSSTPEELKCPVAQRPRFKRTPYQYKPRLKYDDPEEQARQQRKAECKRRCRMRSIEEQAQNLVHLGRATSIEDAKFRVSERRKKEYDRELKRNRDRYWEQKHDVEKSKQICKEVLLKYGEALNKIPESVYSDYCEAMRVLREYEKRLEANRQAKRLHLYRKKLGQTSSKRVRLPVVTEAQGCWKKGHESKERYTSTM